MRPYSNILTLPYPCKLAEKMMFDEKAESKGFEKKELALKDAVLLHPIIVSEIKDAKIDSECFTL